jgi:hypothetical protein
MPGITHVTNEMPQSEADSSAEADSYYREALQRIERRVTDEVAQRDADYAATQTSPERTEDGRLPGRPAVADAEESVG